MTESHEGKRLISRHSERNKNRSSQNDPNTISGNVLLAVHSNLKGEIRLYENKNFIKHSWNHLAKFVEDIFQNTTKPN